MKRSHSIMGLVLLASIGYTQTTIAQVSADGMVGTIVSTGPVFNIMGGTRPSNGPNLFHSFNQFSLPTGSSAIFQNDPTVQTIFSRVTGGSRSDLDGTIQTQGNASLFLMNPNGIVFGPNAKLELGGSFVGTTANSIKFEDGIEFSAANWTTNPLLSVKVPIGLQMGTNPGAIKVQGTGYALNKTDFIGFLPTIKTGPIALTGKPGTTFALVAQGLRIQDASLELQDGNLELGSVAAGATVRLETDDFRGFRLGYPAATQLADITLAGRSLLDLGGNKTSLLTLVGQTVRIQDGSLILSHNLGSSVGLPIQVLADRLEISGSDSQTGIRSGISSETLGSGNGATIAVTARQVQLSDGSGILSKNFSDSTSGPVIINARERIELDGSSPENPLLTTNLGSITLGKGKPGDLRLSAPLIQVSNGAGIVSSTFGKGAAADLYLSSDRFEMSGATVYGSPSSVSSSSFGTGNSGDIQLKTQTLKIMGGADLSTSSYNLGNAGNVWVNATDRIEVTGQSEGGASSITSSMRPLDSLIYRQLLGLPEVSQGSAGELTLQTAVLEVSDGGRIYAGNEGSGNAGLLSITADRITLLNEGTIEAKTKDGQGGNIEVNARQTLMIRSRSYISASAGTSGNGGNILINVPILIGLENSDIIANAVQGQGGNIKITTQSLFGLQYRDQLTPDNDITASSEFGISGNVQVNVIGINPTNSLNLLPVDIVDSSRQMNDRCGAAQTSSFIATGRGGIPNNPLQQHKGDRPWHDLRGMNSSNLATLEPIGLQAPIAPLIEASALQIDPSGTIALVAHPVPVISHHSATCAAHASIEES